MARNFDLSMVPTPILERIVEVGGDPLNLTSEEYDQLIASQEELGPFGAGLEQAEASLSTAFAAGAQELGLEEAAKAGLRAAEEAQSEAQRRYRPGVPSIIDEFSEEGVLGGIAALPQYTYEQLLFSAPQLGAQLGAGAVGTLVGGPVVGAGAAIGVGTPFFAGQNIQRQMQDAGAALEDVDTGRAVITGAGQSALDIVLGRYLGVFGKTRSAEELAQVAKRGIANRVARAGAKGALVEAPTEALQQVLEVAQADPDSFFDRVQNDPTIRKEFYESLIAGGLVGGAITAPTGIIKPTDPAIAVNQDLEAHMREEREETARMNQFAEDFGRAERDSAVFAGREKLRYQDELMAQGIDPLTAEEAIINEGQETISENQAVAAGMEVAPRTIEGELLDPEDPGTLPPTQRRPALENVIEGELGGPRLPRGTGAVYAGAPEAEPGTINVPPEGPDQVQRRLGADERPRIGQDDVVYGEAPEGRARPSETMQVTPEGEVRTTPQIRQPSIDLAVDPFQDAETSRLFDMLTTQETANNTSAASRTRKRLVDRLKAIGLGDQRISAILATTPSERGQTRLFSKKVAGQKAESVRELAKRSITLPQLAEFRTKVNKVSAALGKVLKGMGLSDVALRLDRVVRDPEGEMVEGVTETSNAGNILIALSTQIYDPNLTEEQLTARIREVMNHEIIHALRNLGVLTNAEYRSLVSAAKNQKYVDRNGKERLFTYFDRAKQIYGEDDLVIQEEEAVAELFRDWAAGRKKISGKPVSLFKKIINFFKSLGGVMSDNDINSPEQIFEGIMSGRIGSRERRSGESAIAQTGERMFSRRPVNAPKAESNPFDARLDRTIVPVYPESYQEEDKKKKELVTKHRLTGDTQFKPNSVGLLSAAQWIQDQIRSKTGIGTEQIPYTDENIDELGRLMATEALKGLEQDNNAIGWYDEQMTRSKKILSVIEPRIFENDTNESAFDWALAVTSNGQAVPDNFDLALQAFRTYLEDGRLPDTKKKWNKGGDRATAMRSSFNFFNQYQDMFERGEVETPIYEFLDADFRVSDLQKIVRDMNNEFGTDIAVPSGELAETMVKGSFLAGPKIGQGFYQNLRGNFDPLTMDIWWMRMWNRLVNRPFKPETSKAVVDTKRKNAKRTIAEQAQEDETMRIVLGLDEITFAGKKKPFKGALTSTGLNMSDLRKNETFDNFVSAFNRAWNRYYNAYKDANGRPPEKPQIYNDMAVLEEDIFGALQATPANGTERAYMRAVTNRAKELLRSEGVDINTADLQALLWYPEKRLFEALGVRKGQGQDTDYAESALGQAKKEGISDEQIEEALSNPDAGRVRSRTDAAGDVPVSDQATRTSQAFSRRAKLEGAREISARAGTLGKIWNESGQRGEVLGFPVVQGYSVSESYKSDYDALGVSSPDIFEIESSPESAELYRAAITKSKNESPFGAAVFVYSPEEYAGMRLFLTEDGQAGFALKGDDIVSVFNSAESPYKGFAVPAVRLAIEAGGRKLDAYDTVLPPVYGVNGMRAVARLKWDDEYAPSDWDKEVFAEFNDGEPDVVYMAYDEQAGLYEQGDGTYVSTPDQAEAIQEKAQVRYSRRFSATAPDIATPEDIVDRMVGQKPPTKLMALFNKYIFGAREGENGQTAFIRNFINKFEPLFQIDNFLNGKLENFDPADSVGRAAELSQGVTGRAYHMLTSGALRFNKETGEPEYINSPDNKGLEEIFAPIGEKFQREYSAYAMARRELKLRAQKRRGFVNESYEDMVKLVADLEAKHPFFKDVHADYQRFNSYMVDFAKDAGVLDEQMAKEFQNMDYVPFYRLSDVDANTSEMDKALSSKAAKALKNVKGQNPFDTALEGGEEAVGDLYMNVAKNAEFIVMSSLKNFALQKTANALEKANGLGFTSWGRKATADDRGEIVTFYDDGVEQRYKISDPSVWAALASLDETKKSGWVNALAAVAGIFRTGITIAPSYMAANLIRGKVDAYVRTGVPLASFNETFKKTFDAFRDGDQARQLQLSTGMGGYTYGQSAESIGNTLKRNARIKNEFGGPVLQRIGDSFVNIVKNLEKAGEATEMAERLVLMDRLMIPQSEGGPGLSRREASYRAMNLINYGRRGAGGGAVADVLVNVLIPTVPFLNARIQGLYKFAEDPRVGGGATTQALVEMYGRGLMITAISASLAGLAMQDERWDDEPLYEKVGNDIFYIGDYKVRIPRAFEVGAIFGTIPVLTIDAVRQRDGDDLAAGMVSILTNTFAFNPIPQGIKPVVEVATNTNFFKGGELANVAIRRLPTELQARPDTPQLYKFMSQYGGGSLLGLSPIEIQQIAEGYTGSLGAQLIATSDVLLANTSRPSGAFGTIGDVTGFSRFLKQRGEGGSKTLGEFYELKREIDQFHAGLQEMQRTGQSEIVADMLEDKGATLGYRKQFARVSRQLSEINRQLRAVMNQDIPADVKSERVRALREQKADLTRQVVSAAKQSGYF